MGVTTNESIPFFGLNTCVCVCVIVRSAAPRCEDCSKLLRGMQHVSVRRAAWGFKIQGLGFLGMQHVSVRRAAWGFMV
jgi:hypothetical protein